MSTNIRIVHAHDFVRATPEGKLDLERSKELLLEVASASAPLAAYEIILDTRKAQSTMSITDLWYLAAELKKRREAFSRKTAVLCPLEEFDHAGFFALCAQNQGFHVRPFTSFEEAVDWLIAEGI